MKKRIFCIMLATVMLALSLPLYALAGSETAYPVWIAGIQVTESNKADVLGDADGSAKTVVFDSGTNTLTLSNATIATTGTATGFGYGDNKCGIKSELETLNVNLVGKTQIGRESDSGYPLENYSVDIGFSCTGDITFTGNADSSLVIYDYCAGISGKNVTFKDSFKGKLTIRDSGGSEPMPPCAINAIGKYNYDSDEYIGDGTVNILGGTFDLVSFESNGIASFGNLTVKNAKFTIDANNTAMESRFGDIIITDCAKVAISAGDENIEAGKTVKIVNCPDVTLSAEENDTVQGGDIYIENSTVDATAKEDVGVGIYTYTGDDGEYGNGTVTIKDSKVSVRSGHIGIECDRLFVSGGKTDVYSAGDDYGVMIKGTESDISISGSTVRFTGKRSGMKFEKTPENGVDPFTGSFAVKFAGNATFDTFTSMQTVSYKSEDRYGTFSLYPYIGDTVAKSVTVAHTHDIVKVDGVQATTEKSGYKSYYKCNCGKYFEDEAGKTEITDIEKWKSEGGKGYLPKLTKPISPLTGDTRDISRWMILLTASFITFACIAFCRKRDR